MARERSGVESKLKGLGWGRFIKKLVVHEISGDHYEILNHGQVEELANILLQKLE